MVSDTFFAIALSLLASVGPNAPPGRPLSLQQQLEREGPAALAALARTQGNPIQGAVLFYQPQLSCTKCHTSGEPEGASPLGPDLARPDTPPHAERLVEAILHPSKSVRKGYEAIKIVRKDGSNLTGLMVEDRPDAFVLRDAAAPERRITVLKNDIEAHVVLSTSLMPNDLVNQLADRQQFLDLLAFLLESAEFGPARARSLRPDPATINPPLPAYEHDLDHAGLLRQLDQTAFERGERLYHRLCASCHGTPEQPGSMPTSLKFTHDRFRNGADPLSLYRTLTFGYGMMAAQTTLVPQQKYDVIHYIREAYLKTKNPTQYVAIDSAYLASLPRGRSRGPDPSVSEPWQIADYGNFLAGTYEVGLDGDNIAYKGIAFRLDPGPGGIAQGKAFMLFEHDTMRMTAGWHGQGFIDWHGIHFDGRHETHPRIVGEIAFETANEPGWGHPQNGSFADPRLRGRDGKPYGPLPKEWCRYRGLYHVGDHVMLSYTVGSTEVLESPGMLVSSPSPVFTRTFQIGPRSQPLTLCVMRLPAAKNSITATIHSVPRGTSTVVLTQTHPRAMTKIAGVVGLASEPNWKVDDAGRLLLTFPAGEATVRCAVWMASTHDPRAVARLNPILAAWRFPDLGALIRKSLPEDTRRTHPSSLHWPTPLTTQRIPGKSEGPFAVDTLTLPVANPWQVQLRLSGLDFLSNGRELAVCTWDGDVWRVTGLERADCKLTWRRIASGLFQPLGLKVMGSTIYVGCRDQIVILRDRDGNGETDFYECFNSDHQVTESFHEFAMGLQADAEGNFLYTKGARHGRTAVVPHHGTLLRVSKDGQRTEILATGFRAPNGVCVNPDGTFFITDQEGHWVPKNRINWVRPGKRFYGNLWGYTDVVSPSDDAQEEPICWITNRFDRSPSELVWVTSPAWGTLQGSVLNLSYGYGKVYIVPHERKGDGMHGGMVALPIPSFPTGVMRGRFHPTDGHLYLCGMFAWAGSQQSPGGLYRMRATGKPAYLPIGYHVTENTIALTFSDPVDPASVQDVRQFGLKVWDLRRSKNYGSPHLHERALRVTRATLSSDQRTIALTIPELAPTRGLELWYSIRGVDGREIDGLFHGSIHAE